MAQRPRGPRGRGRGGARARRRRRRWRWRRRVVRLLVVLLEAVEEDVDDPAPRVEQVDDLLDVEAERRALHSRQRPSSASRSLRSTPWQVGGSSWGERPQPSRSCAARSPEHFCAAQSRVLRPPWELTEVPDSRAQLRWRPALAGSGCVGVCSTYARVDQSAPPAFFGKKRAPP